MTVAALLAGVDAARWAGVTLLTRSGASTIIPAVTAMHDGGHYPDAVSFLTGWSAARSLESQMTAQWTAAGGAGTLTAGIDAGGRVYVSLSGGGAGAFTVTPGTSDPWGWGGVVTSSPSGTSQRATATGLWLRGTAYLDSSTRFVVAKGAVSIQAAIYGGTHQGIPTVFIPPGGADADQVTSCLEDWDNDARDSVSRRIRWCIDGNGRVVNSWPSATGWSPTWTDVDMMRWLGFTGLELPVTANQVTSITATYSAPCTLVIRSGVEVADRSTESTGSALDLASGRVSGRRVSSWRELTISAQLSGGVGVRESESGYADEEMVYQARVAPHLWPGARVTLLPQWGDPRIGYALAEQVEAGVQPEVQNELIRSDVGGIIGRQRCQMSTGADRRTATAYAMGSPRVVTRIGAVLRRLPSGQ